MRVRIAAAVVSMLVCAADSIEAHHSDRMIAGTFPVWIKGTVQSYERVHPHAMIALEVIAEDGERETWSVEGPNPGRIQRLGLDHEIVQPGDVIEVCGFYPQRSNPVPGPAPNYIHGKIVVTPDGQRWAWGAYGRLKFCISEDEWHTIESGHNSLRP